jgi:hypothetical protein
MTYYSEIKLADAARIPLARIRRARLKLPPDGAVKVDDDTWLLTESGFEAALVHLGLARFNAFGGVNGANGVSLTLLEEKSRAMAPPGVPAALPVVKGRITKVQILNRYLVQVRLPSGERALCHTLDRSQYSEGQEITLYPSEGTVFPFRDQP